MRIIKYKTTLRNTILNSAFMMLILIATVSNSYGECITQIQFDSLMSKGVEMMKKSALNTDQMIFIIRLRNTMGNVENGTLLYSEFNKYYFSCEDEIITALNLKVAGSYFYSSEYDLYLGLNAYTMDTRLKDYFQVRGITC